MKKIFIVLVALMILLTSVSFAEDLSALSDEELFTLCRDVLDEIERRHSAPAGSEAQEDLPAFATLNEALAAAEVGFASWGQADYIIAAMKHDGKYYRLITMLDDHAKELYRAWETDDYSGYEAYREYAFTLPVSRIEELMEMPLEQAELDALIGKTLPELLTEGFEPYCVYIEGPGRDYHAIGLSFGLYSYDFEFDMTDDEYAKYCDDDVTGDWPAKCIYYNGFANRVFSLDYNADGSLRTGTAPIREKTAEPADTDASSDLPAFATISEAYESSEGGSMLVGTPYDLVFVLEYGGKSYRVISQLDDRAKELYNAGNSADGTFSISDEFYEYAQALPVTSIEELPEQPMTQAEIDALNGKTVRELIREGYEYSIYYDDAGMCSRIGLLKGLYSYDFDTDEAFEKYRESRNLNDLMDVKVSNGAYSGFSGSAVDLSYPLEKTPETEPAAEEPAGSSELRPDLSSFASIGDAFYGAGEKTTYSADDRGFALAIEYNGKYYRLFAEADEHAKELFRAVQESNYSESAYETFNRYSEKLPVTSIEEMPVPPLDQYALNALNGKTIRELTADENSYYSTYVDVPSPPAVVITIGLYDYNFTVDVSREEFLKVVDTDAMLDLKVKNGEFTGFSYRALWPDNVSFTSPEPAEEPAAKTPEISDSTVLYYLPCSLKNEYHLDPNCSLYNPDCLPLPCSFTYAELSDDMYRDLEPCPNCGAPERPLRFATLRDAMNTQAEQQSVSERSDRIVLLMEKDGEYLRVVTMLDARAKALYAVMQEDEPSHQAFTSYAWGLPVTSVEKVTSKPLDQWELGSMSGKTIRELIGSRTDCFTPCQDVSDPPVVELSFGLFSYNFEVDTTREEYLKLQDTDAFWDLKVKNGTFSGFSYHALDMDSIEEP